MGAVCGLANQIAVFFEWTNQIAVFFEWTNQKAVFCTT